MTTNQRVARTLTAGALLLSGMFLAGCTGQDPTPTPSATQAAGGGSVRDVDVLPGTSDDGFEGAADEVTVTTCEAGDDGWDVAGEVTNPDDKAASYRIYVSFLSPDGTDTLGLLQVDVNDVAPEDTTTWDGALNLDASKADCVLRVEKTTT